MMWEVYTGQQAFRRLHYGQFFDIVVSSGVSCPGSRAGLLYAGAAADAMLNMLQALANVMCPISPKPSPIAPSEARVHVLFSH